MVPDAERGPAARLGDASCAPGSTRSAEPRAARRHRARRLPAGLYARRRTDYYRKARNRAGARQLHLFAGPARSDATTLTAVLWDSPAFNAGLTVGARDSSRSTARAYSADRLKEAITAAKDGTAPIELMVKNGDQLPHRPLRLPRRPALPAPRAHRGRTPARLDDILAARATKKNNGKRPCVDAGPLVDASLSVRSALGEAERHEAFAVRVCDEHQHTLPPHPLGLVDAARHIGGEPDRLRADAHDHVAGAQSLPRRFAVGMDRSNDDPRDCVVQLILLTHRRIDGHQAHPERTELSRRCGIAIAGGGHGAQDRASRSSP